MTSRWCMPSDSKKQITLNTTGLPAPELYAPGLKPPIVNCPTSGCPGDINLLTCLQVHPILCSPLMGLRCMKNHSILIPYLLRMGSDLAPHPAFDIMQMTQASAGYSFTALHVVVWQSVASALIGTESVNILRTGVNGNSSTTPGGPGGRIAIYAEALQDCNQTSLQLVTTGGLGQRGQDGGELPHDFDPARAPAGTWAVCHLSVAGQGVGLHKLTLVGCPYAGAYIPHTVTSLPAPGCEFSGMSVVRLSLL